jgi:hypothetical protein
MAWYLMPAKYGSWDQMKKIDIGNDTMAYLAVL